MHVRLAAISKKLRHAQSIADSCAVDVAKRFSSNHPYRICLIRLSNKARYAAEIIDFYGMHLPPDRDLASDQTERVVETEKWFFIGTLSVIEYSMPLLIGSRGSQKLKADACNGPFSSFLVRAESEGVIDPNEKSLLEFSSRVRNDLIHRNGVSRISATMAFNDISFDLVKGEMIEGHWGMLSDLATLAIYSTAVIIEDIEEHWGGKDRG
ncbi:hypothetical protein [Rhodanobacter sp. Root627]|uniref:hypothetical protein n=1 Tax=Rhodanobacter sp. Root627 TaxID=1736572 RepID=UPI000B303FA4|nr:hypothetical protein [Rhodanobacter sp. Root627]